MSWIRRVVESSFEGLSHEDWYVTWGHSRGATAPDDSACVVTGTDCLMTTTSLTSLSPRC